MPAQGAAKYNAVPRLKNIAYVSFLPRKSDDDAQKILPIILANESNAPNPVAIAPDPKPKVPGIAPIVLGPSFLTPAVTSYDSLGSERHQCQQSRQDLLKPLNCIDD